MRIEFETHKGREIKFTSATEVIVDNEIVAVCWDKRCAERIKRAFEALDRELTE
jgi:hypothetical protein